MERLIWFYLTDAEIPADVRKYYQRGKAKIDGVEKDGYVLVTAEGFDAHLNPGLAANRDSAMDDLKAAQRKEREAQAEITRLNTVVIPALNQRVQAAETTAANAVKAGHQVVPDADVEELARWRKLGKVDEVEQRGARLAEYEAQGTVDEVKANKTKAAEADQMTAAQARASKIKQFAKAAGLNASVLETLLEHEARGRHEGGKRLLDLIKLRKVDDGSGTGKKILMPFVVTTKGEGESAEEEIVGLEDYATNRDDWSPHILSLLADEDEETARGDNGDGGGERRTPPARQRGETQILPTGPSGGGKQKAGDLVDNLLTKEQKQRAEEKPLF